MNPAFSVFQKRLANPLSFRLFLFTRLPAAFFAGLRIEQLSGSSAVISVRYKWFNTNPFRSMYFAIQSMAAEMSTGLLASGQIYKRDPAVSMLVVGIEAQFFKKVVGKVFFTCHDGEAIARLVEETIATGQPRVIQCHSTGTNEAGEIVSEFTVTWSFKARSKNTRHSNK